MGVNVYGRRPRRFIPRINTITEVSKNAHLCPGVFKGIKICLEKILTNHD